MADVVAATSNGTRGGCIDDVENEWTINGNRGVKAARRLPSSVPYARDELAVHGRWRQRKAPTVAKKSVSVTENAGDLELQSFDGRINES